MVGIDVSDRSVKVVELSRERRPKILAVGWQPLEPRAIARGVVLDRQAVAEALQRSMRQGTRAVEGREVCASIPEAEPYVRVFDLPIMSEEETHEAVKWAVRRQAAFDPDHFYLDWQVLGTPARSPRHRQVLVGAARREVVDALLSVLDGIHLKVVALEFEAQSVARSLLPREAKDIEGVLLVDIGATMTNVALFDFGAIRFAASVQQGGDMFTQRLVDQLGVSAEVAVEQKALVGVLGADGGAAAILREAVLELAQAVGKLVRDIMSVQETAGRKVREILIAGGAANMPGIDQVFGDVFANTPIQFGNPWTNLAPVAGRRALTLSKEDMLHFTTALGCAIRQRGD